MNIDFATLYRQTQIQRENTPNNIVQFKLAPPVPLRFPLDNSGRELHNIASTNILAHASNENSNKFANTTYEDLMYKSMKNLDLYKNNASEQNAVVNKLVKERLNAIGKTPFQNMALEEVNEFSKDSASVKIDLLLSKVNDAISTAVFDVTNISNIYEVINLIELNSYRFSTSLLSKYLDYLRDISDIIFQGNLDAVFDELGNSGSMTDLFGKLADKAIATLEMMQKFASENIPIEERKNILDQYISNNKLQKN